MELFVCREKDYTDINFNKNILFKNQNGENKMILVSYDIRDDKLRAAFSKFILRFGERKQYSVYEIKNSPRILALIKSELDFSFSKKFGEEDSVLIIETSKNCKISRYGFAKHDESDIRSIF